jgi:cytochrome c oxidase assembly factor CtaG
MPPALSPSTAFTQWTFDPLMMGIVVMLLAWYLVAVRRVRASGAEWATGRVVAFAVVGLGGLTYTTMSWLGVYQSYLFYARAGQTVMLVLVVPLFLAMGRPITLAITAWPGCERRVRSLIGSRVLKVLLFPAVTTLALVAVPFSMYFTSWYTGVFNSPTLREFTYLVLMAPGLAFFWTLLRVDPVPKEWSYGVSMWITAAEVIGDAFFGLAIIADTSLLGGAHYRALGAPWSSGLASKQVIGGGVIWILGDLVGLPFLAAQLIQLMREDRDEAAIVDAELDARDPEDATRPWWETESR